MFWLIDRVCLSFKFSKNRYGINKDTRGSPYFPIWYLWHSALNVPNFTDQYLWHLKITYFEFFPHWRFVRAVGHNRFVAVESPYFLIWYLWHSALHVPNFPDRYLWHMKITYFEKKVPHSRFLRTASHNRFVTTGIRLDELAVEPSRNSWWTSH